MRVFARIEDGVVRELHRAEADVSGRFHAALRWVEVTGRDVREGFLETAAGFVAPVELAAEAVVEPTIGELQAAVAELAARIAAMQLRG